MKENFLEAELYVPRDKNGFIDLHCRNCGAAFRVKTIAEELWCPVCGRREPILTLLPAATRTQIIHNLRLLVWGRMGSP
jgi:uncharacterized protein YbaR (Trm112 family)